MSTKIQTFIDLELYNKLNQEKKKLQKKEEAKVKSRRKRITLVIASRSIARKIR